MRTEIFQFSGACGTELPAVLWMPDEMPGMVLQITHSMTEHIVLCEE